MDTSQDELTKAPATSVSRRKVLQTLTAITGAGGLSALSLSSEIPGLDPGLREALAKELQGESATGQTKLTGHLVFPGSPDYESARLGYARQFSTFPLVIVFCQNAQDVVNAINWCREHNVTFRARSGRHCLEGWSSVDGGVIIDVSNMKEIHVDTSAGVATVQTGLTQGEVVEALAKTGYTIPAGGEPKVGIAGVTLGGGIGLLARPLGLACDHLIGVEMVVPSDTGDVQIIQANEQNNADLLWASRGGGGGNFGIATSFTFKLASMPTVTFYDAKWDWRYLSELFSVWQNIAPSADDRLGSVFNPNSQINGIIESYGVFLGSENQLRHILQPMLEIGKPDVVIKTASYLDAFHFFSSIPEVPHNDKISSAWVYQLFPQGGIETVRDFLAVGPNADANIWCLNWGGAVGRIPTGATAFFHRKPKFYIEWEATWKQDSEEERALTWVEQFREALQPYVSGSYVNVPDRSIGNWQNTYYGDNFARLQRVKSKYDPQNIFHFEQSIPPD